MGVLIRAFMERFSEGGDAVVWVSVEITGLQ